MKIINNTGYESENIFTLPLEEIEKKITESFPDLSDISVERGRLGNNWYLYVNGWCVELRDYNAHYQMTGRKISDTELFNIIVNVFASEFTLEEED